MDWSSYPTHGNLSVNRLRWNSLNSKHRRMVAQSRRISQRPTGTEINSIKTLRTVILFWPVSNSGKVRHSTLFNHFGTRKYERTEIVFFAWWISSPNYTKKLYWPFNEKSIAYRIKHKYKFVGGVLWERMNEISRSPAGAAR